MECMSGGELFDRIVQKEFYSEREAMTAFLGLLPGCRVLPLAWSSS